MKDLYRTLGVSPRASAAEIKRAYRERARELHPDAGGDEESFKEVAHAYEVLSDAQRRERYDRFGDDGTPGTRAADPFSTAGFGGIGDVIDAFFGQAFGGGRRGRQRAQPGRDVLATVRLTLEEVATGVIKEVALDLAVACEDCAGIGSRSGAGPSRCEACGGAGQVQTAVRTPFGQLATATACTACQGTGRAVGDPCPSCQGEGRRAQARTVDVEVPRGVEPGDRLRVTGAGEAGRQGAPAGDLYVEVDVAPHDVFDRDGSDLLAEASIGMPLAALGGKIAVRTLSGDEVDVVVPVGAQSGETLLVRRRGLPDKRGGLGDLRLRVHVETPTALTRDQRALLEQLAVERGEVPGGNGSRARVQLRGMTRR